MRRVSASFGSAQEIAPPSPVANALTGWNEKQAPATSSRPPTGTDSLPGYVPPMAWQASSMTAISCFLAIATMPRISQHWPFICTGMTALTLPGVARDSASSKFAGVIRPVVGSASAKITSAPTKRTALAVARNVMVGTMTWSPSLMPRASIMRWSAVVPDEQATTSFAPQTFARLASNASTAGPSVSGAPERSRFATAAISSSSIS